MAKASKKKSTAEPMKIGFKVATKPAQGDAKASARITHILANQESDMKMHPKFAKFNTGEKQP